MTAPLIIGGGLAGAAAGIDLARSGQAPLLLERETGPHDKICGEFLSGEAVAALAGLGVDARRLGAVPITRVEINAGHRQAAAALPFPALSLSRRVLDEAMLERAAAAGVAVQRGVSVRGLADGVAQTTAGDIAAPALLLATGKHDVRGLPRPDGPDEIGLKMYFRDAALSRRLVGTVAVTFFDGGYAGLQPVEGGRLNLCLLVNGAHYRELGNWPALLARLTREPALLRWPMPNPCCRARSPSPACPTATSLGRMMTACGGWAIRPPSSPVSAATAWPSRLNPGGWLPPCWRKGPPRRIINACCSPAPAARCASRWRRSPLPGTRWGVWRPWLGSLPSPAALRCWRASPASLIRTHLHRPEPQGTAAPCSNCRSS